jgi:hypothetical protein
MALNPTTFVPPVVSAMAAQQGEQWTIGAYLPLKDAAFVRVMNPVRSDVAPPASWASIAGEGFVVDATTEWCDVADDRFDGRPDEGSLDPETARNLARILRSHTATPAECFFLIWEGYAGFRDDLLPAVKIELTPADQCWFSPVTSMMAVNPSKKRHGLAPHSGGSRPTGLGWSETISIVQASMSLVPRTRSLRSSLTRPSRPIEQHPQWESSRKSSRQTPNSIDSGPVHSPAEHADLVSEAECLVHARCSACPVFGVGWKMGQ